MKALFLVVIFSLSGHPDEFYKERVEDGITLMQCQSQAQLVMPRLTEVFDGYKLKSFGCMTEEQLREGLRRRP